MPKLSINRVILVLTASDIFTWGFFYSITTLVGIYLETKLGGQAVEYIGIGTGIYMLSRAGFQIPIGYISDKLRSYTDEAVVLAIGNILMGLPFLLYPIITTPYLYYLLQFIFGIGTAMNLVNWRKLFARNLDRNKEGYDYAVYETALSVFTAIFSIIIGLIGGISQTYFDLTIFAIGIIMIGGCIWPLLLLNKTIKR